MTSLQCLGKHCNVDRIRPLERSTAGGGYDVCPGGIRRDAELLIPQLYWIVRIRGSIEANSHRAYKTEKLNAH